MRLLAIDFGTRRMGFAYGDSTIQTATPLKQLDRKDLTRDLEYIKSLISDYEAEKIVLGYPLNMDGTRSDVTGEVERFAEILKKETGLPVDFIDERLTSFEAEEMIKSFQPDIKKRKKIRDSISALVILRSYMEAT